MALVPIKSTVPPSDLTNQPNGHIDPALLVQLLPGSASLARLHHTVARGWFALADAALKAGGWTLWWTSVADTYRTYEVQLAVFLARYEPVSQATYLIAPSANRKRWDAAPALGYASAFWIKKNIGTPTKPQYPATAAVPGTSPHGLGCAIDGALKTSAGVIGWTAALPWLIDNARSYGFAWSLQSEPWHIQWVEGNHIPQAVLDFENPPQPEPTPKDYIPMSIIYRVNNTDGSFVAFAATGAHVAHFRNGNNYAAAEKVWPVQVLSDGQQIVDAIESGQRTTPCPPEWVGGLYGAVWDRNVAPSV